MDIKLNHFSFQVEEITKPIILESVFINEYSKIVAIIFFLFFAEVILLFVRFFLFLHVLEVILFWALLLVALLQSKSFFVVASSEVLMLIFYLKFDYQCWEKVSSMFLALRWEIIFVYYLILSIKLQYYC
jgi:hypothetical protein